MTTNKTYTLKWKLGGGTVATRVFSDVRDAKLWARCKVAEMNEKRIGSWTWFANDFKLTAK